MVLSVRVIQSLCGRAIKPITVPRTPIYKRICARVCPPPPWNVGESRGPLAKAPPGGYNVLVDKRASIGVSRARARRALVLVHGGHTIQGESWDELHGLHIVTTKGLRYPDASPILQFHPRWVMICIGPQTWNCGDAASNPARLKALFTCWFNTKQQLLTSDRKRCNVTPDASRVGALGAILPEQKEFHHGTFKHRGLVHPK